MKLRESRRLFRGIVLLMGLVAVLYVVVRGDFTSAEQDASLKKLGLAEFVQTEITYNGVMHELYWHYEFANQMLRVGRTDDAVAHLKMLTFYVNLLPYLTGDKIFFKDPVAKKKFDDYAQDLLKLVAKISREINSGNTDEMGREMEKRIAYLCYHCHKDLKTPIRDITPYGKKIEMGPADHRPEGERTRIHR